MAFLSFSDHRALTLKDFKRLSLSKEKNKFVLEFKGSRDLHRHNLKLGENVDAKTGKLTGVAVITKGEAKGHGMQIDDETLTSILICANAWPQGLVRANADHYSGVGSMLGNFSNFRLDGECVRADLAIYQAATSRDLIIEAASINPASFGTSVSFDGYIESMEELVTNTKTGAQSTETFYYVRCSNLDSVDVVTTPAANPDGMFSEQIMTAVDTTEDLRMHNLSKEEIIAEIKSLYKAEFQAQFEEAIKPIKTAYDALIEAQKVALAALQTKFDATNNVEGKEALSAISTLQENFSRQLDGLHLHLGIKKPSPAVPAGAADKVDLAKKVGETEIIPTQVITDPAKVTTFEEAVRARHLELSKDTVRFSNKNGSGPKMTALDQISNEFPALRHDYDVRCSAARAEGKKTPSIW